TSNTAVSAVDARPPRHTFAPLCREVVALRGVGRSHREGLVAGARVLHLETQLPRLLAESAAPSDADSGAPDGGDPHVASLLVDYSPVRHRPGHVLPLRRLYSVTPQRKLRRPGART